MISTGKKDLPLEALRGLAAIVVLLSHLMASFFPQWSGAYRDNLPPRVALNGQVWFGLINGSAAVTLFFVLSGFVLTRRFLLTNDQRIILRGIIKRWPRLAGPVCITVLSSWFLFAVHAYHFTEAGTITKSPLLSTFGYVYRASFEPHFWVAFREGTFLTFFQGESYYDPVLWTMRYEFIGSFIAFALATIVALVPAEAKLLRLAVIIMVSLLCHFGDALYVAFPAGVALAAFLPDGKMKLPVGLVVGMILTAIYLFGFTGSCVGMFVLASRIFKSFMFAHIFASMLIIVAIELASDGFRLLLSGPIARFLGALSFPLYLVHVLVLCSLGCVVLLWAQKLGGDFYPNFIASVATIIGSIVAAVALGSFNERWVALVNRVTDWLLLPSLSQTIDLILGNIVRRLSVLQVKVRSTYH